jgi:hypothetical protein
VLLLPFLPQLWSDARAWSVGAILVPLFVSATLWSGALSLFRGLQATRALEQLAVDWDANFDPVVLSKGEVHVEGERLPRGEEDGSLILVDPEETVPAPTSGGYIIVRKRTIIRDSGPSVELKQLQEMIGVDPLRIEGKTVTGWVERWGTTLQLGFLVVALISEWLGTALGALYGLLIGALLVNLFGKSRGLTSAECTRVGLATMAVKPVISTALALLGSGVNVCLGLFVWPALGVALGAWALSRLPPSQPRHEDRVTG